MISQGRGGELVASFSRIAHGEYFAPMAQQSSQAIFWIKMWYADRSVRSLGGSVYSLDMLAPWPLAVCVRNLAGSDRPHANAY